MPSVLPVRRVVIGQNAHAEMSALIAARRPDLELRGAVYTDVTAADLDWADAYIGFRRPPLPTMAASAGCRALAPAWIRGSSRWSSRVTSSSPAPRSRSGR